MLFNFLVCSTASTPIDPAQAQEKLQHQQLVVCSQLVTAMMFLIYFAKDSQFILNFFTDIYMSAGFQPPESPIKFLACSSYNSLLNLPTSAAWRWRTSLFVLYL